MSQETNENQAIKSLSLRPISHSLSLSRLHEIHCTPNLHYDACLAAT